MRLKFLVRSKQIPLLTKHLSCAIMHKGGMEMTLEQKILMALVYRKMTQTELASLLGMSISNFNQRLKRGSFKVEELEK